MAQQDPAIVGRGEPAAMASPGTAAVGDGEPGPGLLRLFTRGGPACPEPSNGQPCR